MSKQTIFNSNGESQEEYFGNSKVKKETQTIFNSTGENQRWEKLFWGFLRVRYYLYKKY